MAPKTLKVKESRKVSAQVHKAFGKPISFKKPSHEKRKIFISSNNIIMGIASDDVHSLQRLLLKQTKRLTRKGMPPATHLLIFNLNPQMEHCDIVHLCSRFAFPVSVNYFPGSYGRAWLKFEDQSSALRVMNALRHQKVWGNQLAVGLVEKQTKFVGVDRVYLEYHRNKMDKYLPKPVSGWKVKELRQRVRELKKGRKQQIKHHEGAKLKQARLEGNLQKRIDSKKEKIAAVIAPIKEKESELLKEFMEENYGNDTAEKDIKMKRKQRKEKKMEMFHCVYCGKSHRRVKSDKIGNFCPVEMLEIPTECQVLPTISKNAKKKLMRRKH